jgi:mRNA-degrading endonuclease toxin of MazEF toxin-antitoxin module
VRRGDVYWYDFGGRAKRRPVVVLTGTKSLGYLSTATVAAVSTTIRGTRSEVALSAADGLPKPCVINLHQLHTIEQTDLGPLIAQLPEGLMRRVEASLTFALGFGERSAD